MRWNSAPDRESVREEFRKELKKAMDVLQMDHSYADRDLNGFSGGEKKAEKLLMLKPDLAILDETDSGLDVDAVRTVSKGNRRVPEESAGLLAGNYTQHENSGIPACGCDACAGRRKDDSVRR